MVSDQRSGQVRVVDLHPTHPLFYYERTPFQVRPLAIWQQLYGLFNSKNLLERFGKR